MNSQGGQHYTNASVPAYASNLPQGHTGYAGHTVRPDHPYQGATYPATQGYYTVPPPPPVANPSYHGGYSNQQPTSQQPISRGNGIQQQHPNSSNVPGQAVYLGNTSITPLSSTSGPQRSTQPSRARQGNKDARPKEELSVSITAANGKRTSINRNSKPKKSKKERTEMEVADGNLRLQLPASGSTVEKPPDGGLRAWLVVAACATLNACGTTSLLILALNKTSLEDDIGEDPVESIMTACQKIRLLAAPLVAIAIVLLGYQKVAIIGSFMVSLGFFISGFLDGELSGLMGVLVGGLAGLGLACWYLCAIIPILEYFEKRRRFALMLTNIGSLVSTIIIIVVSIVVQMDWTVAFKCMLVTGAVGLAASFFLRPLELTMKGEDGRRLVEKILGVLDINLFKDFMLYFVMLLYFFDKFGGSIPTSYTMTLMIDKEFSLIEKLVQLFLLPIGIMIGYIIALILRKNRGLITILLPWGYMDLFVGFMTLQMPAFDKFGWVATYTILFGITQGVILSILNNTVPDTFGVLNIPIVSGLLGFSAGIGELIAPLAAEDANKHDEDDEYSAAFYLAASMLLTAGVIALVVRYVLIRKSRGKTSSDNDGKEGKDNDGKEVGDEGPGGENEGDKSKGDNSEGLEDLVENEDIDEYVDDVLEELDNIDSEYA